MAKRTHGMTGTPEYKCWGEMKQRCLNPNSGGYHDYGARGITVSKEWLEFTNFYDDMGTRPTKHHSIERVDVNKGYTKSNCCWANPIQQGYNRRTFSNNTSGYTGVSYYKPNGMFRAQITIAGVRTHLGYFKTRLEAHEHYLIARASTINSWDKENTHG